MSVCPWIRLSRFHSVSPWRIRINSVPDGLECSGSASPPSGVSRIRWLLVLSIKMGACRNPLRGGSEVARPHGADLRPVGPETNPAVADHPQRALAPQG